MTNFCTHCGHQNKTDNLICTECGKPLANRKKAVVQQNSSIKSPRLKSKIVAAAGILLLASVIGLYLWGSSAASAETAAAGFTAALKEKNAKELAGQTVLSDGRAITVQEAEAFIRLYGDLSPDELANIARVEKKGKVMKVFDAYKVVLPAQQASFDFQFEGLTLRLNGEDVVRAQNNSGDYTFSSLSPGLYDAEFFYKGDLAEFNYPFELAVELQEDVSWLQPIYEELPLGSVVFELETYNSENPDANKIIIGDKEIPVGPQHKTDEIGPILLDGSMSAQAEIGFPWGKQLSEPVEIDSSYHSIAVTRLEKEQQTALSAQLSVFAEEYVEALGTRNVDAFSTVTKDQLNVFEGVIKDMALMDQYFKGSLIESGIDEESIQILEDGKTVNVAAELVIEGGYDETADTKLDSIVKDVSVDFVYDIAESKWLVEAYNEDILFWDVVPTKSVEGSRKIYQTVRPVTKTEEVKSPTVSFDEVDATSFFNVYNDASVAAINSGDFAMVSYLIDVNGPRLKEQSDFIDYLFSKGITEEHLSTEVEQVKVLDENFYEVTTIERFIINGTENSNEKIYRTVTKVKVDAEDVTVYELISTTEI